MTSPGLTPAALCAVFQERASAVHELIEYSYSAATLGVSEESITDMTLVEMHRRLKRHVLFKKYTKHQESNLSGADWLWTIGRPGRWISLLVQAKLARPAATQVHSLHHGKGSQRTKLVTYAKQINCIPLYVVYTAFKAPSPPVAVKGVKAKPKTLPPIWRPNCPLVLRDVTQMGCVVVDPRHVEAMHLSRKDKSQSLRLLAAGLPWACLFCCKASTTLDLADAVAQGLSGLPSLGPSPRDSHDEVAMNADAHYSPSDYITGQPPAIVQALLGAGKPARPPPVSGVAVISSEPLGP